MTQQRVFQEPEDVSKKVFDKYRSFLGQLQYKTFRGVVNYYEQNGQWPTSRELADHTGFKHGNAQPRTSELRKQQILESAGKRRCSCSDPNHNHYVKITTWKPVDDRVVDK